MSQIQLKVTRESLGISLEEMAKRVAMEPFWYKRFEESGKLGLLPNANTFERIVAVIEQKQKRAIINVQEKLDLLKPSLTSMQW